MCDQQRLGPACAYAQTDQSLCLSLEYYMNIKLLFCQPRVKVTSCFVYKVMGLTFHDRINTQLIYKIEIAQVVARRITKPQRIFSRFESHWLLFFIHFLNFFWRGGEGRSDFIILFVLFFFLFIYFFYYSFISLFLYHV